MERNATCWGVEREAMPIDIDVSWIPASAGMTLLS
jgi:hypothetical protein